MQKVLHVCMRMQLAWPSHTARKPSWESPHLSRNSAFGKSTWLARNDSGVLVHTNFTYPLANELKKLADVHTPLPKRCIHLLQSGLKTREAKGYEQGAWTSTLRTQEKPWVALFGNPQKRFIPNTRNWSFSITSARSQVAVGQHLNHQGTAGFSPCFPLPGFYF